MKKNKKHGFTLIELLAIIVILAIIAVITVPIILNIIEDSKKGSVQDSAYGYKDAVEKNYLTNLLDNSTSKLNGTYMISDGEFNGDEVNLSGTKPTKGYLIYENNKLTAGCLEFDGYKSIYSGDKFNSAEKGECELTTLYFSFDSTATMGQNGKITSKVTEENIPSEWTYWIKETTLNGVNNYQLQGTANQGMFDTESECLAMLEGAPGTYECRLVTEGYSIIQSRNGNSNNMATIGLYDTENECLSKIELASEIDDSIEYSCSDMSNKYTVFFTLAGNTYSSQAECNSHLEDENLFSDSYRGISIFGQTSCVPQETVQYEVCGVENETPFCISNIDKGVFMTKMDELSMECEENEYAAQCRGNDIITMIESGQLALIGTQSPLGFCGILDPVESSSTGFAPAVCLNER